MLSCLVSPGLPSVESVGQWLHSWPSGGAVGRAERVAALVAGVRAGDAGAVEALVAEHHHQVVRLDGDLRAVAVEALHRACQADGVRDWACYLGTVIRHAVADEVRRQHRASRGAVPLDDVREGDLGTSPSAETLYLDRERHHALQVALGGLSADDRDLIDALYVEGRGTTDLAAERGVDASTVRRTRQRVLGRLRQAMAGVA